jgi:hypothetical protein
MSRVTRKMVVSARRKVKQSKKSKKDPSTRALTCISYMIIASQL